MPKVELMISTAPVIIYLMILILLCMIIIINHNDNSINNNGTDPTLPKVELMISTAPVMPKNSWIKTVVKISQAKRELMVRKGFILRRMSKRRSLTFYKSYLIEKDKMRKNDLSSSAGFSKEASRVTLINENWGSISGDIIEGQVTEDGKEPDLSL